MRRRCQTKKVGHSEPAACFLIDPDRFLGSTKNAGKMRFSRGFRGATEIVLAPQSLCHEDSRRSWQASPILTGIQPGSVAQPVRVIEA
jgi:hypothetical protein